MNMKKRMLALLLALVLVIGVLAGCGKKEGPSEPGQPEEPGKPGASTIGSSQTPVVTAKYAYQADYKDISTQFEWVNQMCAAGENLYLLASVRGEEHTETDEATGETYTYYDSREALFQMDLQTGECTELENFAMPEIPEGWMGGTNVYSMQAVSDGTLWALVNLYTYRYNTPEDFDPSTDEEWNYYEEGENKSSLLHIAADGSILKELNLQPETDAGEGGEMGMMAANISSFYVDDAGNVYTSDWQTVYVFDSEGNQLFTLPGGDNGGNLCMISSDTVGICTYFYDEVTETSGRRFKPIDVAAKDFGEEVKIPQSAYSMFPGDDVYDFYYDNNGKIFGYDIETETNEKVVDWIECDVDPNSMSGYCIMPDGRVVAMTSEWQEPSGEDATGHNKVQLITLTRVDASALPERTVITLACMYLDYNLRSQIVNFNKTSDRYRIVVKDYSEYNSEDDYSAGLTKLNTEILGGKVPDLFLVNDNMPINQYAGQGVIADLYQFLDNDESLTRESLVQPVLKALEKDGKIYQLPLSFYVQTAFGLNKVVGDYETWTLADLQDAMTKLQPDADVMQVYNTKNDMLYSCVTRNISAFVDWTTATVRFDSPEFIALLEFCNSFPEEFDWENYDWSEEEETTVRMNSGKQLLQDITISNFEDYIYQCYGFDSGIKFVGYPSENGLTNHSFITQTSFAISAVSPNQDAAWAFVRQMLLDQAAEEDNHGGMYYWAFPIMQEAFDRDLKEAMTPRYELDENGDPMLDENGEPIKIPKMSFGGGVAIASDGQTREQEMVDIYELSQEDADTILNLIESTKSVYNYDESIMKIIDELVPEYFAGDKTAEETAAMIQNRANLYVIEQS